jgi:glycine/D-amino acid oxidase-like deaminating enzyme
MVVPNARAMIERLLRHCARRGVIVRTSSRVVGLVVDSGRVVGVEYTAEHG